MHKLLAVLFAVLAVGCSSSYIVSSSPQDDFKSTSEFNDVANGKRGLISLENGNAGLQANGIHTTSDSLFWNDETGFEKRAALSDVTAVAFTLPNVWEGMGLGFLSGAGAGFLYASAWVPANRTNSGLEGLGYVVFPAGGGLLGTIIGGIYGGVVGHTETYTFSREGK